MAPRPTPLPRSRACAAFTNTYRHPPDGTSYAADTPRLLAWVHVAGAMPFLDAWIRFGEPGMSRADQDRYFADVAPVAEALGADPVPRRAPKPKRCSLSSAPNSPPTAAAARSRASCSTRPAPAARSPGPGGARASRDRPFARLGARMHGLQPSRLTRPAVAGATYRHGRRAALGIRARHVTGAESRLRSAPVSSAAR